MRIKVLRSASFVKATATFIRPKLSGMDSVMRADSRNWLSATDISCRSSMVISRVRPKVPL